MFIRFSGLILCLFFACGKGMGQSNYYPDSLKKSVFLAKNDREKISTLLRLAGYYASQEDSLSERYASQAMEVAEMSRDRRLMIYTYIQNGHRYLRQAELAGSILLAIDNFQHAEKLARENGLDARLVDSYCGLSEAFTAKGENEKALSYNNLALSVAGSLDNDSAKVSAYSYMGDTYMAMNEKLLAFRNYLEGLNIAESSKNEDLIRRVCWDLRGFYAHIGENDKAIDYEMRVFTIDRKNHDKFRLVDDYNNLGRLFTAKKQYELSLKINKSSIAEADTLHFDLAKLDSYIIIFSIYFSGDQKDKCIIIFNYHKDIHN